MASTRPSVHCVVKYFWPVAAGIETNMLETYSTLQDLGWDVTIHTSRNTLTTVGDLKVEESLRGVFIKRYPWNQFFGFWPELPPNCSLLALHNCNLVPHIPILLVTGLRRILGLATPRIMLTPHGGFTPEWRTFPLLSGLAKKLIHTSIYCWLINTVVDSVRAVSVWERDEMISYGVQPSKITVISNGIETSAFHDATKHVSKEWKDKVAAFGDYIIQVGRIHPIKNFETVIQALPALPVSVHFVIAGPVGDEEYKQSLLTEAASLGVLERVHFVGVVRDYEKFYLMKKAIAMVHLAMWESYCNVVHEGMSQGLVCLVSNVTALPYLIKDGVNGYCLPTRDVQKLVATLKNILDPKNKSVIHAISEHNATSVREHSWENVAKKMHTHYKKLISTRV